VPPVAFTDLDLPGSSEGSAEVAARVAKARQTQEIRFGDASDVHLNADAEGDLLESIATPDPDARELLMRAAERFHLSARGYHRVLRVARTIADLDEAETVQKHHLAEALSFRIPASAGL
jgi:magnesium chelatase family protein